MKLDNNDLLLLIDSYIDSNIIFINDTIFNNLKSTLVVFENLDIITLESYKFSINYLKNCRKEIISIHE